VTVSTARLFSTLAGGAARRPLLVVALAVVLGLGGAALALRLHPSAATNTFVGSSSSSYRATQGYYRAFGEEPVDVMVQGNLQQLLLSSDLERLLGLEGCLSGKVPRAALPHEGGSDGPCGQLARLGTVKVVIGPGTFVNEAVLQIDEQLSAQSSRAETQARQSERTIRSAALAHGRSAAEAHQLGEEAGKATLEHYVQEIALVGAEYGLSSPPSLNDPSFVATLVFDSTAKVPGTPKQRFAYLFPSREAALVSVRLKAGTSEAQRTRTIALVRRALAMPEWHLQHGEHYLLTGEPVVVSELTNSITRSLELLLVAVLLVMAVVLSLIFRGRPRLLPLGIAALAAALTFGGLAAVGASLTVAQVAVLPVLIGLAVDYAIQFLSRVQEAREEGAEDVRVAIERAAAVGGPTLAAAAAAGAGALLVLTLSPVPTVRGFGLLLVVGIAVALLCALVVGSAVLALAADRRGRPTVEAGAGAVSGEPREHSTGEAGASGASDRNAAGQESASGQTAVDRAAAGGRLASVRRRAAAPVLRAGALLAPSWRGAQELLRENILTRFVSRAALGYAVRNPGRVLGVGLVLAALGWGLDTQTHVETNLERLVPQNLASLRNLDALERASGVGGEIDLEVSGANLASPAAIEWMSSYQNAVLKRFGYTSTRGCGRALLCPAFSLPTLFSEARPPGLAGGAAEPAQAGTGSTSGGAKAPKLTRAEVDGLLRAIPPYFSQNAITANRRAATLAFGIRLGPLEQQQHVVEAMRASLHPPRGLSAQLVGLPVLAAQSGAQVAAPWRRVLTLLAGLAVAALVLLAAFRGDRRRALTPLLPVALATGWSALVVFVIRVPLNPMSVTLSALVIAISTEFSVLLSERHRQERLASGAAGVEGGASGRASGGRSFEEALRRTYSRTGAAVAASGVTAIAGFGVLVLSDIRMLRDFGVVTLVDLSVSLVGVLVALPAALLLAEPGELTRRRNALSRPLAALRARVRPRHEPA
jgi:predicted RND superfamily exporter protein